MQRQAGMTRLLDEAPVRPAHWRLFAIVSANYFLDGVIFSIAPLVAYLIAPPDVAATVFALNLLAETAGAVVLGRLADVYGRRTMFIFSLAIEVAALAALFFTYTNVVAFAVLTSLATFGIGGEFGAAYAALAELMPRRHRGKAILAATNFWNVGAAFIAGLSLYYAAAVQDPGVQVRLLLASALGTAVVVGLARLALPESPRWLSARGRAGEAAEVVRRLTGHEGVVDAGLPPSSRVPLREALARYRFRLLVLAVVTVVQYVTYGMVAYYAPYAGGFAFPDRVAFFIFVANLGASVGALPLIALIDRSRRAALAASFAGGTLTAAALLAAHEAGSLPLYTALLFANLFFSEWAWGSVSALQSELFPTSVRASVVGLLVGLTGVFGALVVYAEQFLTARAFLALAAALWAAGLAAAAAWALRGRESAGTGVEELEAP